MMGYVIFNTTRRERRMKLGEKPHGITLELKICIIIIGTVIGIGIATLIF